MQNNPREVIPLFRRLLSQYFPEANEICASIGGIDLRRLRAKGIAVLLIDVDNTIALCKSRKITREARQFIREAVEMGFTIVLLSNVVAGKHRVERVAAMAKYLGITYHAAKWPYTKPHPRAYVEAIKLAGRPRFRCVAMIDDQCGTGCKGAVKLGIYAIQLRPLGPDGIFTRPRRYLERLAGRAA